MRRTHVAWAVIAAMGLGCGTSSTQPLVTNKDGGDDNGDGAGLVLFQGGQSVSGTWTWNGSTWSEPKGSGPPARLSAAMAELHGKAVMFGGYVVNTAGENDEMSDTWTWNGTSWAQETVSGPSGRDSAAMAELNGVVVLFGGEPASVPPLSDTSIWDGKSWTEANVGGPTARAEAVMAEANGVIVLFGGFGGYDDSNAVIALNDTWTWDGTGWTSQNVTGPSARYSSVMTELGGKIVLFGGLDATGDVLGDTWTWDSKGWTQERPTGAHPSARYAASMGTLNGIVVLQGGKGDENAKDEYDTWTWNGTSWTARDSMMGPYGSQSTMTTFDRP